MNIEEARLYLEHTSKEDFNLEEHQQQNRYEAIQVVFKEIERLKSNEKTLADLLDKEQKKNKKAIDYIEKKQKDDDNWLDYELCIEPQLLLDILKGDDKE